MYRATAWYCLKSGHPLPALVCARVLEAHGADASDLDRRARRPLRLGVRAARQGRRPRRAPGRRPAGDRARRPAARARRTRSPTALAPRRARDRSVQGLPRGAAPDPAAVGDVRGRVPPRARRPWCCAGSPSGALVIREGEPGNSFFFVAGGAAPGLRDRRPRPPDRARAARRGRGVRRDGAAVGAAAVGDGRLPDRGRPARGRPRSRSPRSPTSSAPVAEALHGFTRERLLGNLMATSPLFKPFNRMQQRDLLRRFTSHDVAPGTVVINEGEEGRGLFVVLVGRARCLAARRGWHHGAARRPAAPATCSARCRSCEMLRTTATVIAQRARDRAVPRARVRRPDRRGDA